MHSSVGDSLGGTFLETADKIFSRDHHGRKARGLVRYMVFQLVVCFMCFIRLATT